MGCLVWICTFLLFHGANSYVLLTANVDDIHSIVNQVATSGVVKQLKDIWDRATESFRKHYTEIDSRAHVDDAETDWHRKRGGEREQEGNHRERILRTERRKAVNHIMELGRNASLYLRSMKDMFDRL